MKRKDLQKAIALDTRINDLQYALSVLENSQENFRLEIYKNGGVTKVNFTYAETRAAIEKVKKDVENELNAMIED